MTSPTVDELVELEETERVETVYAVDKKFSVVDKNGNERTYVILDHEIKELHSQSLLDDVAYICAYFPTAVTETRQIGKEKISVTDWKHQGYFIINSYHGIKQLRRQIKPIDDMWLKSHFKINVLPISNPRWQYEDMIEWKKSEKPTDPQELVVVLMKTIKKYIDFDDDAAYYVLLLWIVGTYFYRIFPTYPYLDFTGTKRSGKTKTLELIRLTAFNTIMSPDFSGSTLFRLVEQTGGTLLLDEAENFKNQKSENAQHIRTLLIQGFKKEQYTYRTNKESFDVQQFNLYSPKALGHINAFDDVLEDRCIQIVMKRSISKEIQNSHPIPNDPVFAKIRNLCYRIFLEYAKDIDLWKQKMQDQLTITGRERELWDPIMTLGAFFESFGVEGIVNSIKKYIQTSHIERQTTDEDENLDYRILKFIGDRLDEKNDWLTTMELFNDLRNALSEYQIPEWFTARALNHALKRLGFTKNHKEKGTSWYITKANLALAKERLGITDSQTNLSVLTDLSVYEQKGLTVHDIDNKVSSVPSAEYGIITNKTDTSDTLSVKQRYFVCETCNAGPIGIDEESLSSGNILKVHQKQSHKIKFLADDNKEAESIARSES